MHLDKAPCDIDCPLLQISQLPLLSCWIIGVNFLYIVRWKPSLFSSSIISSPPAAIVLLHIGDDSILAEGEFVISHGIVVIEGSDGTGLLLLLLEGEVDWVIVDGVFIWILYMCECVCVCVCVSRCVCVWRTHLLLVVQVKLLFSAMGG